MWDEREPVQVVGEIADREPPLGALPDNVLLENVRALPTHVSCDLIDAQEVAPTLFGVEEEVDVALGAGDIAAQLGRGRPLRPRRPRPGDELPSVECIPSVHLPPRSARGELTRAGAERDHDGRHGDEECQAEQWV